MLAPPEKGSRSHIKLWLAGKDPNEKFNWSSPDMCACGQYARETYGEVYGQPTWLTSGPAHSPALMELNLLARDCAMEEGNRTFGRLLAAVDKAWAEPVEA